MKAQRLVPWLVSLTVAVFVSMSCLPAQAAALKNGPYYISPEGTSMVVGVAKPARKGRAVVLKQNKYTAWTVTHQGGEVYRIGKDLVLTAQSQSLGARVIIEPWKNKSSQRWRLVREGGGFAIINPQSGLRLDLSDNQRSTETPFKLWKKNGSSAQKFVFRRK